MNVVIMALVVGVEMVEVVTKMVMKTLSEFGTVYYWVMQTQVLVPFVVGMTLNWLETYA